MSLQFINAPDLVGHWINGQPDAGSGNRRGNVFNPAQGRVARQVANSPCGATLCIRSS